MSVYQKIISGLLDFLEFKDSGIVKTDAFDPESELTGKGTVTADLSLAPAHPEAPEYPDYEITVSIKGMTFVSEDPKEQIIRQMLEDVCRSMSVVTPAMLQKIFPPGAVCFAIYPVGERKTEAGIDNFNFIVDYKIVVGNLNFE